MSNLEIEWTKVDEAPGLATFSLLLGYGNKRYNWFVLISSVLSFGAYLVVRTYIIGAPGTATATRKVCSSPTLPDDSRPVRNPA